MKRRRFLQITGITGLAALDMSCARRPGRAWSWSGVLFGADTSLQFYGIEEAGAAAALSERCFVEMRRLERLFSLYLPDSTLCRLNEAGRVDHPPDNFVELVATAVDFGVATEGAFDITVQPVWEYLRGVHDGRPPGDDRGLERALALVDYRKIECSAEFVRFRQPGMKVTLNGIAQGYITDQVARLLKEAGVDHALVNMGEYAAIGGHPEKRPWEIGIQSPGPGASILDAVSLESRALSVSGGYGYTFDPAGKCHHLLNPRSGKNFPAHRVVAVAALDATTADAVSTACAVVDDSRARVIAGTLGCSLNLYQDGSSATGG